MPTIRESFTPHPNDDPDPQPLKAQRKTRNLGLNTAGSREDSYKEIETRCGVARCTDSKHEGERTLPIRKFYLNQGGKGLQGACRECQTQRRKDRILRARDKFAAKSAQEVRDMYVIAYGPTKTCSKCGFAKPPTEFPLSISMETGLHNHCISCSIGVSQGNGGLRDFIFMPDKDGIKYAKKAACERCGGVDKLAVDHILPIAKGGTDCIPNKQTLCIHCNSKKSDTIDCPVNLLQLSERYRDPSPDFTDSISLTHTLTKRVYEFRKKHIDDAPLAGIRESLQAYIVKHNLGHNLERILGKIAALFNKS